jgi:hypothetical protein
MTGIGNVAHIAYFIPDVGQVTEHYIKGGKSAQVSQVHFVINGWPTRVKTHEGRVDGRKQLFTTAERVSDGYGIKFK